MRRLQDVEYALLRQIESRGDFGGYQTHSGEDHPEWVLFGELEDRGLVGWVWGPISEEMFQDTDDWKYLADGPFDPCVTPLGRTAMLCYRASA